MNSTSFKYIIVFLLTHLSLICYAQNFANAEFEAAVHDMQNYDYKSALLHVENYLDVSDSTDEDTYYIACFIGGTSAYFIGEYNKSKRFLDEILNISNLPKEIKIQSLCYQLTNLIELSLEDDCLPLVNELSKLYETTASLDIIYALINYYSFYHKYQKVLDLEMYVKSVCVPVKPNDISEVPTLSQLHGIYMNLANAYYNYQDWNNSLKYWLKSFDTIIDDNEDTKSLIYTKIADVYSNLGDRKNALKYQELALSVSTSTSSSSMLLNEEVRNIINIFNKNNLANDCDKDNQRFEAIKLLSHGILLAQNEHLSDASTILTEALKIFENIEEMDSYYYTLGWLCHVYRLLGLVNEYNSIKSEIKQAIYGDKISNDQIKLFVISKYGEILSDEGDIDEAVLIAEKSLNSAEEIYDESNPEIFSFLYKLCSLYIDVGELTKSKGLIDRMKALKLESKSDKTDYYSAVLLESYWMRSSGKIGEMIQLLEKNANVIENDYEFLEIKSKMFGTLGVAYSSLGNFQRAQLYDEKALKIDSILYGDNSPHYASSLINLSEMYAVNGLNDKALDLTIKALNVFETLYGKKNKKYIKCLEKLASQYQFNNPQKSKELYKECLSLCESLYSQNSREYAECLIWSNLDLSLNPSITSVANVKRGIEIIKSLGLTNYEFYPSFLHFYCIMLYVQKDFPNLYVAASELLELTRNRIYYNFLIMPENQRETFWKSVKPDLGGIEQYAADYARYAVENNDFSLINEYSGLGYNARLLKKGLLLTSSRNIENIISKIDNQDINRLIAEISIKRNKLSALQLGSDEYEQTERIVNNLERELLELISSHGDFMSFTNIKWQDVQDVLMPGEVAVEFFSFPCQNDIQYGMTFIGSEGEPLIFTIFAESELNKYLNDDTTVYDYKSPGLYKTIWPVLEVFSDIKNAHTIYFSADGKLNTIAIENLCDSTGHLASEKRNIVRLSSTRELLQKRFYLNESATNNNIVLYGGLDYNSILSETTTIGTSNPLYESSSLPTAQRAFKNRAQYLPGTLKEVEALSQRLRLERNSNIFLYTGSNGTEQSVNNISNLRPTLLHIATHGFYFDENNIPSNGNSSNRDNNSISVESRAMKESGLLLSGANHKLMGEEVTDVHNDGILTAEEISNISLDDIDLLVLSACETGLGSVSGEGVFGLQRGFKLSGVNCIVMSLWKVDDEATKELMTNFYKNLLKGSSKIEALQEAQKKIRETPGYEDPEYWAGFILLDALN